MLERQTGVPLRMIYSDRVLALICMLVSIEVLEIVLYENYAPPCLHRRACWEWTYFLGSDLFPSLEPSSTRPLS